LFGWIGVEPAQFMLQMGGGAQSMDFLGCDWCYANHNQGKSLRIYAAPALRIINMRLRFCVKGFFGVLVLF
jgi:hypothetical protein